MAPESNPEKNVPYITIDGLKS